MQTRSHLLDQLQANITKSVRVYHHSYLVLLHRRYHPILKNQSKIFIVLHNVHSVSKVIDTAQVVYSFGFQNFVVTKAEGSAAQTGVPEANKLAIKMKRNFIVMPKLIDAIELLDVENPLLIPSPVLTKERINLEELSSQLKSDEKLVIVVSGSSSSFSRKEMDLGQCRSIDTQYDIGPAGTTAVVLYMLKSFSE
ncbi:MAG: hypothetical protein GF411_06565 [Candidatus Lokiarchaeota archaeon]|nr:hypothetical protein [Candidatus Lokiarchaeota archaeon]